MNYKDMVTMNTVEASQKTGISYATLAKYCRSGCLRATNIGEGDLKPRWSITEIDLKDFVRRYNNRTNKKEPVEMPQEFYEEEELVKGSEPQFGPAITEVLDALDDISKQRDATKAELERMKQQCKRASGIALELAVLLEEMSK